MQPISQTSVRESQRFAGLVKRYHEWPTSREQTVAEHSWHVARLFMLLFPDRVSVETLTYIQWHDAGELGVGDIPYPVKKNNPDLKEIMDRLEHASLLTKKIQLPALSAYDTYAVKVCDLLEMHEFGYEDLMRGCQYGRLVMDITLIGLRQVVCGTECMKHKYDEVRLYVLRTTGEMM